MVWYHFPYLSDKKNSYKFATEEGLGLLLSSSSFPMWIYSPAIVELSRLHVSLIIGIIMRKQCLKIVWMGRSAVPCKRTTLAQMNMKALIQLTLSFLIVSRKKKIKMEIYSYTCILRYVLQQWIAGVPALMWMGCSYCSLSC